MGALLIWATAFYGGWQLLHHTPSSHSNSLSSNTSGHQTVTINVPADIASVDHADKLPTGPSGQLMPPGTMAPDGTYRNTYTSGNCTWYVAGRRQVPSGWGNAVSWYYHATSSGWAVGTTPAIAAIAWTPAGSMGHVALVEGVSDDGQRVYISEMNYRGLGVKSYRWTSASSFKYIY